MKKYRRKIMLTLITLLIVFLTVASTTYAWISIFTYASTSEFEMNLKVNDIDSNTYLVISPYDFNNDKYNSIGDYKKTFSDSIDPIEIKRQILKNIYGNSKINFDSLSSQDINNYYSLHSKLYPSSTTLTENNKLDTFYKIDYSTKEYFKTVNADNNGVFRAQTSLDSDIAAYFKFDIYLTVDTKEGINDSTNDFSLNVYLSSLEDTLTGTKSTYKFLNSNPFKKLPTQTYDILSNLPDYGTFEIDSKNAARFALEVYNPIAIGDSYTNESEPIKTIIYQGGYQTPNLDNGTYDLGGILEEQSNTALQELLVLRKEYKSGIYTSHNKEYEQTLLNAIERGKNDLEITESNANVYEASTSDSIYLGVKNHVQTKLKITVYLWFEGWDADCLSGIDDKTVTLNLSFTGDDSLIDD